MGKTGRVEGGSIKGLPDPDEKKAGGGLRGFMQMDSLIPFLAALVSAAFASVSLVWNSDRRATTPMTAIFVCTGIWALVDLFASLATDPLQAAGWLRWAHLPALMLGPCTLWLLGSMLPQIAARLRSRIRLGAALSLCLGIVAGLAPATLDAVVSTDWGWMPRYGWLAIAIVPLGTILPVIAAIEASRAPIRRRAGGGDRSRARGVATAVGLSLLAAISTEYALPLLELPAPRLGALGIACGSALIWLRILHETDDLAVTPHGMARAMLAELRDGVVLVGLDGRILASNLRFAELCGRRSDELAGTPLSALVDASIDRLRAGLEDRESVLRGPKGEPRPVSISSSSARGPHGALLGVVAVFRDRRDVDAMRRRLLTSGRLAAIGELAAGIAHEVNNPIAFIRSDLNLLAERLREVHAQALKRSDLDSELRVFEGAAGRIETSLESIERVAQVVADVKGFAHVGGAGQGGSDPVSLVEGAMRLARLFRGSQVEIRLHDSGSSERIEYGQELKQVLLALLRLLVEGCQAGGRVDVRVDCDDEVLRITLSAEPLSAEAAQLAARFAAVEAGDLRAASSEFGLAIATELVERLGGVFSLEPCGSHALELRLQLPIASEAVR